MSMHTTLGHEDLNMQSSNNEDFSVAVITASDRAFAGVYPDTAGPAVRSFLLDKGYSVKSLMLVPDDFEKLTAALKKEISAQTPLILTVGGTGFSPRDITPEVTRAVCDREALGLAEFIRLESLKITPRAALSRAYCGIAQKSLIINLSGSKKAACEQLEILMSVLDHALAMLRPDIAGTADCAGHKHQTE